MIGARTVVMYMSTLDSWMDVELIELRVPFVRLSELGLCRRLTASTARPCAQPKIKLFVQGLEFLDNSDR